MERTSRRDARARIVGVLAEAGAVSRAELARRAALAPSTVSAVVSELHAAGLVVEPAEPVRRHERGAIGRPPVLIALHRRAGVVAGLDFGKRHVRLALSDLSHALLAERHLPLDADLPAKDAIALAVRLFDDALEEAEVLRDEVVGVGMGLPGPVHRPSGELGNSTILPGWAGTRAAPAVQAALGVPVEVENDANLGALGEWMWGAGRGADDLAYVKAATGIGAGFIVAGAPYVGAGGTAGELGHTVVDPGGPICRCGNRGCLETYAGAPALLGSLRDVHGDGLGARRGRRAGPPRRRGLPACDRRRRAGDRHRGGDAVQLVQPAPGRGRRGLGGGGRAAARPAAGIAGAWRDPLSRGRCHDRARRTR